MCGRFTIADPREQQARFGFVELVETRILPVAPSWNVAPTRRVPVVVEDAEARRLRAMTWAFRPSWMRDAGKRPPPINARAETLLERPMFRSAVPRHRCLVPASGFYEWAAARLFGRGVFRSERVDRW